MVMVSTDTNADTDIADMNADTDAIGAGGAGTQQSHCKNRSEQDFHP